MANFGSILEAQSSYSSGKEDKLEQEKISTGILYELQEQSRLLNLLVAGENASLKEAKKAQKSMTDMFSGLSSSIGGMFSGVGEVGKSLLFNKFAAALGLGALGYAFRDEISASLDKLQKELDLSFGGFGKKIDKMLKYAFPDLVGERDSPSEDIGKKIDQFILDLFDIIDKEVLQPLSTKIEQHWPIMEKAIIDGLTAAGESIKKKFMEWIPQGLKDWWDNWAVTTGITLGAIVLRVFGFAALKAALGKLFPIAMLAGSIGKGFIDAWDTYKETGDFKEAVIAFFGGILGFLSFGLIDKENVRPIIDEIDKVFIQPIVDFFRDIGLGLADMWVRFKKFVNDNIPPFLKEMGMGFDEQTIKKEEEEITVGKIQKFEKELASQQSFLTKLQESRKKLEDAGEDTSSYDRAISETKDTIEMTKKNLEEAKSNLTRSLEEIANAEQIKAQYERITEIDDDIRSKENTIKNLEKNIEAYKKANGKTSTYLEEKLATAKREITQLSGEKQKIRDDLRAGSIVTSSDNVIKILQQGQLQAIERGDAKGLASLQSEINTINSERIKQGLEPIPQLIQQEPQESYRLNKMSVDVSDQKTSNFTPVNPAPVIIQDNKQTSMVRNVAPQIGVRNEEPTIRSYQKSPAFGLH